ncbi:MAG TPA: HepT-like ribonuclease domain-containing protein [Thermoanaerobaculia bacterium]|nr:HepT-like ribonuclease domain-containing protein [Thermoanaerobaculia bacterium]
MTKRSEEKYLADMLQYALEARELSRDADIATFYTNRTLQLALAHLVQTVGEAATRVPESTRATLPDLPWERITGMRHRLVHDYGNVRYDVVWDVVQNDLPPLIAVLERIAPDDE